MAQKGLRAIRGSTSWQTGFTAVIIGDRNCGRTSLLTTYMTGVFPEIFIPSVCDRDVAYIWIEGHEFRLRTVEIDVSDYFGHLRPLTYSYVDVVLICYDVMSPTSFNNVFLKWYPEMQRFCDGVPIILVGCKTDLRSDKDLEEKLWSLGQNPIKYTQGEEARRKINAVVYLECSAKCNENVDDVFREATKQALMAKRVKDRCALS